MINKLNINNQLSVDDALNILHQSNCGFSYYTDPSRYVLERKDLVKLISHAYCEGYDYREGVLQNRIITIQSIGDLSDSEKLDLVARATGIITPTKDFVHTNAGRIRSMSVEELAEWLTNICDIKRHEKLYKSIYNLDTEKEEEIRDSYGDLLKWLQSEAE